MKRLTAWALCLTILTALLCTGVTADSYQGLSAQNGTLSVTVTDKDAGDVTFYEATALPYTAAYGTTDGAEKPADEQSFADTVAASMQAGCDGITTTSSTGLPYQAFEVDVSGVTAGSIVLSYDGATVENERFALKAFNVTTGAWDTLATAVSGGQLSAEVSLDAYAKDSKVRAMATVDYVDNGSDRMIWSTDQQHYVKFDDLNTMYEGIHNYMVSEYQAGNIGYVINTGDIVDDMPKLAGAAKQWKTASAMFEILDNANVPYGIVSGNHDTGDYPAISYDNYLKYFSEERYDGKAWFGGALEDNESHYDLVTIGNVDFIFLYLGYGVEAEPESVEWANAVLKQYAHRNAVICTHQYLSSRKADWSSSGRASLIYNTIITENDNVLMVLCGHDDGACRTTKDVNGRTVHEILCDYQFVQVQDADYYADAKDPTHSIGSVPDCNGEGYLRSITVSGNSVSMDTFSPITGGVTPYGVRDKFTIDVDFQAAHREITTRSFTAAVLGNKVGSAKVTGGKASVSGTSSATAWMAAIESGDSVLYTTASLVTPAAADTAARTVYADRTNLQALINSVGTLDKGLYTGDSWKAMTDAKSAAEKAAKNGTDEEVQATFTALAATIGTLDVVDTAAMDYTKLTEVYSFNLDPAAWKNETGAKSLTNGSSFITPTVTEAGGLTVEASAKATTGYPQMIYTEPVTFTPEDGKVYLYLDAYSQNGWSMYPNIIQGQKMVSTRWNYVIEGLANKEWDAGNGSYCGVYDVTQALLDAEIDLTQPITITMAINVVPGPLTINSMKLLTGAYPEPLAIGDILPWIILGAVVLIVIVGLILFAVLYKPKKKAAPAAVPAAATPEAPGADDMAETPKADEPPADDSKTEV